jgi:hypothetical protein
MGSHLRIGSAAALVGILAPATPALTSSASLVYTSVQPCRIVDTRAGGGPLLPDETRPFHVVGSANDFAAQGGATGGCNIPGYQGSQPQVRAVLFNFVAVEPQRAGHLRAWPTDQPKPTASILNYAKVFDQSGSGHPLNLANGIAVPVSQDAIEGDDLSVFALSGTHVVVDVVGYFSSLTLLDGSDSKLDADQLDGQDSTDFARRDHDHASAYVDVTGDSMEGTLSLPTNGLLVGSTQLVTRGGKVGLNTPTPETLFHVQGGDVLVRDGDVFMTSSREMGINISRQVQIGSATNPEFRLGRITAGGDGSPEFRVLYDDNNAAEPERPVFEFDAKGIVASVKPLPTESSGGRGSHFEGFIRNDVQPLFRLNSAPQMQLEMGPGGNNCTDVALRRRADGALTVVRLAPPCAQPTASEQAAFATNGSLTTTGEMAPAMGFRQPGISGERLKVIRGGVSAAGGILLGSGFSSTRLDAGKYQIVFSTPFAGSPGVQLTPISQGFRSATVAEYASGLITVRTWLPDGSPADSDFFFTATGVP